MNLNCSAPDGFTPALVRARRTWWIVGTAEYQVTRCSLTVDQNDRGLKRDVITTVPPVYSVERVEAINPWTWKRGITQKETSFSVRP
jgi:hypothetical protein